MSSELKQGDKVVHIFHKKSKVQEVKRVLQGNWFEVFSYDFSYCYRVYLFDFRLATQKEIKQGYRDE